MAARILIQFVAQAIAVLLIRKNRPDIKRPFKMWLFPLPVIVSLVGYLYVFSSLGLIFIGFGLITLLAGLIVYLIVAKFQHEWPFNK